MKTHRFARSREHRLAAVLSRHLARGGVVIEAGRTDWRLGNNIFIAPFKHDPDYVARHIANRVTGFGWTVALAPLARPPILLANGKLVTHHLMPNGAQEARINGVPEMSEAEWTEYCTLLRRDLFPKGLAQIEAGSGVLS